MFTKKIFHFFRGYVILSVSGYDKEKLINALISRGARLRNTVLRDDSIVTEIPLADFFILRSTHMRAKIHICEKHAPIFVLRRLKKRKGFAVGLCLFVLLAAVGSRFVWTVTYEGVSEQNAARIESAVRAAGLYEGVPKSKLKTPLEMKNIILADADGICWAWVYIRGTKATVRVRENVLPPEVFDPDVPCDIIAMRAGIIKRVVTERGRSVVKPDTAVAPGDTIISGKYGFENESGYRVHSRGSAEALCEHSRTGIYRQYYCSKTYTGRVRRYAALRIFRWEIPLCFGKPDFESSDAETKYHMADFIGVGVKTTVCREYTVNKEPLSYEATVELAKNELESRIAGELLPPAQLEDSRTYAEKIDEETVSVTVTMTFTEQIGTERRIEEVEIIEPKTDNDAAGI